jgi:hypothetical protein
MMSSLKLPVRSRANQVQVEIRHLLSDFKSRLRAILIACVLIPSSLVALCISTPVQAASTHEVINGGTCIAYPPYNPATSTFTGLSFQHWLYGFRGTAYCHLTMSAEWRVTTLSYVLFNGSTSSGVLRARLCVHAGNVAVTCGAESSIVAGGFGANWVAPPGTMPPGASGAYVLFTFQPDAIALVFQLMPVWID